MSNKIKRMNITEFRESGYLQELNRTFLHPLGLSLEICIDEDGREFLGGIWDCRDENTGIFFNLKNSNNERKEAFIQKAKNIKDILVARAPKRFNELGFVVEPIENL